MLLSLRYRFLFVHTAKTGGTSVRAALNYYKWRDPYRLPQFICSRISGWSGHKLGVKLPRHAKAVAAKEMLPNDVFESLFRFAFVRNPWDLQVSSWHHIQRERPQLLQGIDDFDTFLRYKLEDAERPYHYILDASREPQWHHLIDLEGRRIVDFVGHYENLAEDFATACRQAGLHKARPLPHRRKATERTDFRAYYSDASAERVARHFAPDIDHLGYTFD